jgi:LuxR family maltose regulon positive regulatory protein
MRTYERGLGLATAADGAVARGAADMHVGIAEVLYERNDLDNAANHLEASRALGASNGLPKHPWRSRVATARLRRAEGDLEGALDLLNDAERLYVADFAPNVRSVAGVRAQVWIAQGRLSDAWAWARERGLTPSDELVYLHEFEHIVLARLLVAQGSHSGADDVLHDAVGLGERLLVAAQDGGRHGSAIEIMVVLSLARYALGDLAGAIATVQRAAALAEPQRYVRVFLDEGPRMASLLDLAARHQGAPDYLRRTLAAAAKGVQRPARRQALVEPLSERELEVLRLLQSDLGGPDMARELSVSLNTLRTHTRSIYAKLGVTNRRAAVRQAGEMDLLARP